MIKVYQTIEYKNNVITTIVFKGVKVKVEFKGGNVMKGIPARLYTNDPFVQKALDESDQKGRLYRFVRDLPEEGDMNPVQPVRRQTAKPSVGKTESPATASAEQPDDPKPGFPASSEAQDDGGDGSVKQEFDNLADAITYIATTWGVQVESESQARKFIEEKTGVKAVIHKG